MYEKKSARPQDQFQAGESVIVLYQGRYNGMLGKFLGTRADANWADIEESPGIVHAHPMEWIRRIDHRFDRGDRELSHIEQPSEAIVKAAIE